MALPTSRSRPQSGPSLRRVLCVADALEVSVFFGVVLRNFGCDVQYADDAHMALAQLRRLRPDLIVVSLALPDFEAAALIRYLRSDPVTRAVPLLCILPDGAEVGPRAIHAARQVELALDQQWLCELVAELESADAQVPFALVQSTAAPRHDLLDVQPAAPRVSAAIFASTSVPRSAVS